MPSTVYDPWIAYLTDVNPGSSLAFVSATIGWRIGGLSRSPGVDENLSAGPGAQVAYPGSSLERSRNGGATWRTVLTPKGGLWGVDFLSQQEGWAVGVTGLFGTTDGGATWRRLGESSPHPLVRVAFASAIQGFGITTSGRLVASEDGGETWSATDVPSPVGAVCSTSTPTWYVSTQAGALLRSEDAGSSWREIATAPLGEESEQWVDLSCSASMALQSVYVFSPPPGPAQNRPYLIREVNSPNGLPRVIASSKGGVARLRLPAPSSEAPQRGRAPVPVEVAAFGGTATVVGIPTSSIAVTVSAIGSADTAVTPGVRSVPLPNRVGALANSLPGGYVYVYGVSSAGEDEWIYLADAAVGSASSPMEQTIVLRSTDSGLTWSDVYAGRARGPQQGY